MKADRDKNANNLRSALKKAEILGNSVFVTNEAKQTEMGMVLEANDEIPEDAFTAIDEEIKSAIEDVTVFANDMAVKDLPGPGAATSKWYFEDEEREAVRDMDGAGENLDRSDLSPGSVMVPVHHLDLQSDWRWSDARNQFNVDSREMRLASEAIGKSIEDLIVNGDSKYDVAGLRNLNDNLSVSGSDWGTLDNVQTDIQSALDKLDDALTTGLSYNLYVSSTQWGQLREWVNNDTELFRKVIVDTLDEVESIKPSYLLNEGEAFMLANTNGRFMRKPVGQGITTLTYRDNEIETRKKMLGRDKGELKTVQSIEYSKDIDLISRVVATGGMDKQRIETEVQEDELISEGVVREKAVVDNNISSKNSLQGKSNIELSRLNSPTIDVKVDISTEEFLQRSLKTGDHVTVRSRERDLFLENYRIRRAEVEPRTTTLFLEPSTDTSDLDIKTLQRDIFETKVQALENSLSSWSF